MSRMVTALLAGLFLMGMTMGSQASGAGADTTKKPVSEKTKAGPKIAAGTSADSHAVQAKKANVDGPVQHVEVEVGPFDLHRRYRSMEGPWVAENLRISDLLASKHIEVPESQITFVEGNPTGAPSMNGRAPSMNGSSLPLLGNKPIGLVDTTGKKRELVWFKGLSLEVLDEHNKVMPNAEFICHLNVDVDPAFRKGAFPASQQSGNARIITLTQGQTDFHFPDGFAVPVASDEVWTFTFQAANRTTDAHRRIKHLLKIDLVKDSPATANMKALYWYVPYITVVIGGASSQAMAVEHHGGPNCMVSSAGMSAPNTAPGGVFKDQEGRTLSGHWVIPPGQSVWRTPIFAERDPGFASKNMHIHAVWSHIHPLCTSASLVQCDGESRKPIFVAHAQTKTDGGLQIMHIDNILSKEGILLPGGHYYELEAVYENPTKESYDSMVAEGVFLEDENFSRPNWELASASTGGSHASDGHTGDERFCGVKNLADPSLVTVTSATPQKSVWDIVPPYPLFSSASDGPLLTSEKTMELNTSAGKIHIVLDPKYAPVNATQVYKLLKNGAFDGTPINRYEPNFVLQIEPANTKIAGAPPLSNAVQGELRRLPLEVLAQQNNSILHKKWVLSMAHYDRPDTGVSSFSILLGDAPHLDHKYTIFGRVVPDQASLRTIEKMEQQFAATHPYILGAREINNSLVSKAQ